MADATAESMLTGFTLKLNSIAAPMRHSLTYDQGREMARHRELDSAICRGMLPIALPQGRASRH